MAIAPSASSLPASFPSPTHQTNPDPSTLPWPQQQRCSRPSHSAASTLHRRQQSPHAPPLATVGSPHCQQQTASGQAQGTGVLDRAMGNGIVPSASQPLITLQRSACSSQERMRAILSVTLCMATAAPTNGGGARDMLDEMHER